MKHKTVVLYTNPKDGIAAVLRDRPGVVCLHLNDVSVHWMIEEGRPPTDVRYPGSLGALFAESHIINRVFDFNHCDGGRQLSEAGLHGLWGYVALSPLLKQASLLAHENGPRGVSRSLLPLNTQWFELARVDKNLVFPRFEFGFGRVDPDLSKLEDGIQKSLWSYFSWKVEGSLPSDEKDWHRFYVERPTGIPVVCAYHENDIELHFPHGPTPVDMDVYSRVAHQARRVFASTMGEFLMYECGDQRPMFCAFSPYMANAVRSPTFVERMAKKLTH